MKRALGGTTIDFHERRGERDAEVVAEIWDLDTYRLDPADMKGRTVLDLGANIGAFTMWSAAAGAARIRAVEPDKSNLEALVRTIGQNPHVAHDTTAVKPGTTGAAIEPRWAAASPAAAVRVHTYGPDTWTEPAAATAMGGTTPGYPLADLLEGLGDNVWVKCDIEGAEYPLFEAATDSDLRRIDRLVLEWHTPAMGRQLAARTWPYSPDAFGRLVTVLARHHRVCTDGNPEIGGIITAARY
jgi:FkbM family methyltransferase